MAISVYEMPANYEYHSIPKLDESVYLVAQISGWEKLNLLNGESEHCTSTEHSSAKAT